MKKSDKKIDNTVRKALTEVCEAALTEVAGFKWLTHFVNHNDFPDSLSVVCVFDTNVELANALADSSSTISILGASSPNISITAACIWSAMPDAK